MPKGVFPAFMKQVHRAWSSRWPGVDRIPEPLGPGIPKSSTFHLGTGNRYGNHVFAHFQHSSKSWGVGEFTVKMLLAEAFGPPARHLAFAEQLARGEDGAYRLGTIGHQLPVSTAGAV